MKKSFLLVMLIGAIVFLCSSKLVNPISKDWKLNLSEYEFFVGDLTDMVPTDDLIPYELRTPLFSDYAIKERYIKLPAGSQISYEEKSVFEFPVGSQIIKTFYYNHDDRKPAKGRRLMETRVLIKEETGWLALPYVWNDEQTDAYLDVAGDDVEVAWINEAGKKMKHSYSIPNKNEYKSCHLVSEELVPIGPTARQLNSDFKYSTGVMNQLAFWKEKGILKATEDEIASAPSIAKWDDPKENLDARARAYLDINCGHCHSPDGPANTSGAFFDIHTIDQGQLGFYKAPIAAGRGSGGLKHTIEPGKPDQSILLHRMKSIDPGVMMPEISRNLIHDEGIELVEKWIRSLPSN